jgi:transposase
VLAILDDTRNNTLKAWFSSLSKEIQEKIKWLSTDMNKWYKNVVEWQIHWVVSTVDKYHLVQEANRMVDDVRRMNIWLIKMWFMQEEDFIKNKKVTKRLLAKKKLKEMTES